jgi:uncharacterized protein DUF1761
MPQVHINFLAVLVSSVVAFAIGGLWYSPMLFAKQWVNAHGFTEQQVKEIQKGASKAYSVALVCQVFIALAMAVIAGYLHLVLFVQGLKLGFLAWAGFALPLGLMATMFTERKMTVFLIDSGYQLVYLLVMGAIIAVLH